MLRIDVYYKEEKIRTVTDLQGLRWLLQGGVLPDYPEWWSLDRYPRNVLLSFLRERYRVEEWGDVVIVRLS